MGECTECREFSIDKRKVLLMEKHGFGAFKVKVWPGRTQVHTKFYTFSDVDSSYFLKACEDILIHKGLGKQTWNMANYFYDGGRFPQQHVAEYIIYTGSPENADRVFRNMEF